MATYTSNYGWTKPSGSDNVDISVLNDNLDDQDSTIHDAFLNMAPPFSESATYAVDDIVLYGTGLYKCHTAVVTPGSWTGSTNWQVYKLSEGGSGGGGTSNYNQLTNKPQINSVELSGNKTASQLGLMASDGVVANPTGQTTGTLTALEVGGTKYAVPSGGTSDYTDLSNKPQVNGVTLIGNKTTNDLGITASGVGAIPSTDKGANGGVAELDSNGKVPSSQLPSYVDDVLSYASQSAFPATGETGKIYIAEDTNKTYRWSGSAYAEISASLALGETSSTAYRGDRGKTAYDHSQTTGNPHSTTASDVGLGNVPNVSTNDQEPTFTEAPTRNNIASGEKLSVIMGKIQKFFNDLKTVAFSGSYTDLSDKPTIPTSASDITYDNTDSGLSATDVQGAVDELRQADNIMMSDGTTSVEEALDGNSDEITTLIAIANKTYKGVDLTVNFASEIVSFSSAWAWFQNRLDNDNMEGIHVNDYIPFSVSGENHRARIAGIDTFHKTGSTAVGHHVDFISEDCYGITHNYNSTNTNQGNATTGSPFKASELYSWLNSTVYNALPSELKAVIKEKYLYYPLRYTSGSNLTDDNNWEFGSFGKLWLPLEGEIFDTPQWSTKGYGNPYATQYPIFSNDASARIKGAGPGGSRANWWTASAHSGNATFFAFVIAYGCGGNDFASNALFVPICFRLIKAT